MTDPRKAITPARVAIAYAVASASFLFFGFFLMLLMRWQLGYPGQPLPVVGGWLAALFGDDRFPGGALPPEMYNQLGAMHGTVMVFLGVVPLGFGAFGHFLVPRLLGGNTLPFPRAAAFGFGSFLVGGALMLGSFFAPGGAFAAGWTSYPPLAVYAANGQNFWLVGMGFVALSVLAGAINILVAAAHHGAPGMKPFRWPVSVWTQATAAVLLLLAFPPFLAACLLQLSDRVIGTSFFLPHGLVISGAAATATGGGNPLLWQHLFWFLAHPEVYVLILPALGIVGEVIATNARRSLHGYRTNAYALMALGLLSFLVWAHHMFLTGIGPGLGTFFQLTTILVSVPSVILLTNYLLSLRGASLKFPTAMLFALGFLPMFGIGGLTGLPLGLAVSDVPLHDTYYVIGHFHYIVAPGVLFALFAGVYHWFPRLFGRSMGETLGRWHFWSSLVAMNGLFFPMFFLGLAGVSRRSYDQTVYAHGAATQHWNVIATWSSYLLFLAQLPFLWNIVQALRKPKASTIDPGATTAEWAPDGTVVEIISEPYRYNAAREAQRQWIPANAPIVRPMLHPLTKLSDRTLGSVLLVAAGVMFFAAIAASIASLRAGSKEWPLSLSWTMWIGIGCAALSLPLAVLAARAKTLQQLGYWIAGISASVAAGGFLWGNVVKNRWFAGGQPTLNVAYASEAIAFGSWAVAVVSFAVASLWILRPTPDLNELRDRVISVRWGMGFLGAVLCALCVILYR